MIQGLLYAGLSAVLAGSFAVLPKYAMSQASSKQAPVPRPVTAWWLALGFVVASCIWAAAVHQVLSWWGLLSGLLWALSVVGRVACIESCGMCTGNATPDVTTALTAWAYDALYNKATFACAPLGELGYLLLALCLVSIYTLEQQGHVRKQLLAKLQDLSTAHDHAALVVSTGAAAYDAEQPVPAGHTSQDTHGLTQTHSHPHADHGANESTILSGAGNQLTCPLLVAHTAGGAKGAVDGQWQDISWGLLMGALSGVCAGLSQLPFKLTGPGGGGVHFILASSLGMLLFASVNVVLHRLIWHVSSITHVDLLTAAMAPYGIVGGMVLLASMVCGILAAGDESVKFSGAKVIAEASILVSGAWGVLLFHELRSLLQVLFWLLSLQMLCSIAVILAGRAVTC